MKFYVVEKTRSNNKNDSGVMSYLPPQTAYSLSLHSTPCVNQTASKSKVVHQVSARDNGLISHTHRIESKKTLSSWCVFSSSLGVVSAPLMRGLSLATARGETETDGELHARRQYGVDLTARHGVSAPVELSGRPIGSCSRYSN